MGLSSPLSLKEINVALYLGQGLTCQEISVGLDLKYETVRVCVNRLRQKTGLRRKSQLSVWVNAHHRSLETQRKKAR